ncbi:glycosyltransferase, partial [Patescibacteria group bacterium]|nr:glycosyltransferase [Patescibacteria group bacterium]
MSQGKKTTKLTICILAHNSQDTIAQTIESCLVQDCEIAVMSNGCTDKTVEIAETYPVTIYDIPEDIGMPKNIERCFKLDADYIMLMCADDVLVDKNTAKIMKKTFDNDKLITHITRYYYQFLDGVAGAVRVWH